jgi:hypothetical protein
MKAMTMTTESDPRANFAEMLAGWLNDPAGREEELSLGHAITAGLAGASAEKKELLASLRLPGSLPGPGLQAPAALPPAGSPEVLVASLLARTAALSEELSQVLQALSAALLQRQAK